MKCTLNGKIKVKVTIAPKATTYVLFLGGLKSKRGSVNPCKTELVNISSAHNCLDHLSKKKSERPEVKYITSGMEEKISNLMDNVNSQKMSAVQSMLM